MQTKAYSPGFSKIGGLHFGTMDFNSIGGLSEDCIIGNMAFKIKNVLLLLMWGFMAT
jgi:hypothetical protein